MNMVYVLSWSCLLRQTNRETIYLFNTRRRGYFVSFCEYVSRYIRVYVLCCTLSVNMPLCRKRRTHCWRSHTDNVWYQCYFFPFFLVVVVTKASKLLDWLIIIISEHLVLMACRVNSFPKDASNNALIIDLIIFYFFFFPGHILHRHTGVGDVRYACGTDCCIKFGLREHDNFVRKFFPHFFFVSSSSQNIFPFDAVSHGIW